VRHIEFDVWRRYFPAGGIGGCVGQGGCVEHGSCVGQDEHLIMNFFDIKYEQTDPIINAIIKMIICDNAIWIKKRK
jgi:hypothetical protein